MCFDSSINYASYSLCNEHTNQLHMKPISVILCAIWIASKISVIIHVMSFVYQPNIEAVVNLSILIVHERVACTS